MRRSLPVVTALVITCFASASDGGPPTPSWCTVPTRIHLVGTSSGVPDPLGAAVFVITRFGNPVPNSWVALDFSDCSDVRLSSDGLPDGQIMDCSNHVVRGLTGPDGRVTFNLVGASAGSARTLPTCLKANADGIPLSSPIVSTFDLDGRNGLNALDLSVAFGDINSGEYRPRSDYDADNDVDSLDLSVLAAAMFAGGSVTSGTACTP